MVVFGGDFKQILPVIVKGSHAQIVGACIQRSYLWHSIEVLHLTQNMHLNTGNQVECEFAEWQLRVGHGNFTDLDSGEITLPDHFQCAENTVQSLIDIIYPGVSTTQPDEYFADRTILCSRNDDVHDLNKKFWTHSLGMKRFTLVQTVFLQVREMENKGISCIQWNISTLSNALD